MNKLLNRKSLILVLFVLVFLATRFFHILELPVFADEAIYIRWAQLIIDDARQYAFFPLNDGKTPLFVWLMVPLQWLGRDPLLMGRALSVLAGLGQVYVIWRLASALRLGRKAQLLSVVLTTILPFWFFYQRMALMDSLMTLFLSISWLKLIEFCHDSNSRQILYKKLILSGIFLGLALWTKLSAILFIPVLILTPWGLKFQLNQIIFKHSILTLMSVILGILMFLLLRLHPAFSQLFSRGGDFLFSLSAVLSGEWRFILSQWSRYWTELSTYLVLYVFLAPILGLFFSRRRKKHLFFLMLSFAYLLPILILGRVVYARYFLPTAIFFTLSASSLIAFMLEKANENQIVWKKFLWGLTAAVILSNIVASSALWMFQSYFSVNQLSLPQKDRTQYLEEWSSGHGIKETADRLLNVGQNQRVVLATEGYFGTLPDGILMYLHRQNVENIFVMGIGQPVHELPPEFIQAASIADQAWLLVNSHRNFLNLSQDLLIAKY
ncbi:MAG TPA: glycosyltransferase family 39 protein, partial [Candidatus Woesebacteria bacterium]|nr:glycosyltransferase family 39 protein [Candidatus Woesebacteria bacterium]